jgi:tetratricopeptide (TPR) repeat protein
LVHLNHLQEALLSLYQAVAIKPSCYYAWNYRGIILSKLERYHEAISSFNQALEYKPNNADAWYSKARCYALLGNTELASNYLQRALKLSPNLYRSLAKVDPALKSLLHDCPSYSASPSRSLLQ